MLVAAVFTGMRVGELCALKWPDVSLSTGVATVSRTLHRGGLNPVFGPTKNGKARVVPLSGEVVRAMEAVRAKQAEMRAFFGAGYEDHGLVFCQPHGRPLDPHNVARRHWPRMRKNAGLPEKARFHDLRHTFVSRALQAGANPKAVAQVVGHHDPSFMLRVYSHVTVDDTRQAVERLRDYLAAGEGGKSGRNGAAASSGKAATDGETVSDGKAAGDDNTANSGKAVGNGKATGKAASNRETDSGGNAGDPAGGRKRPGKGGGAKRSGGDERD